MKITGVLGGWCPSGHDCDFVYDTDGTDVLVRGRFVTADEVADVVDPATGAPLRLPPHEGLLRVDRAVWQGAKGPAA